MLPLLRELFDRAVEFDRPGPFAWNTLPRVVPLEKGTSFDEGRQFVIHMITTYLDRFQGKWWSDLRLRRYTHLHLLCFAEAGDIADVPLTRTASQYVKKMVATNDYIWMEDYIRAGLTDFAQGGYARFALSVLEALIGVQELSVEEAIIELLSKMRVYHPDEVDDFMVVNGLKESFVRAVRVRSPSETIGDMLGHTVTGFAEHVIFAGSSHELWQKLTWLFQQLPACDSLDQWVILFFEAVANLIYGDAVFDAPPPGR